MLAMRGRYVGHLIIYISEEEVISVKIAKPTSNLTRELRLAASGDVAFHFSDFSRSSRMRSSSRFF